MPLDDRHARVGRGVRSSCRSHAAPSVCEPGTFVEQRVVRSRAMSDAERFADLARAAEAALDAARAEILPRFRRVATEQKEDGSPVTEADRAAERAIRAVLALATPGVPIRGEEYGGELDGPGWLVDPIDGTISFSRGIPLFTSLVAYVDGEESLVGAIDVPALGERYVGWKGGGCRRNGEPVRVSSESELARAFVCHGDVGAFKQTGRLRAFRRLSEDARILRGYTDAFGHALVLQGSADAMVDLRLSPWDVAATKVLVPEAGGRVVELREPDGKTSLVLGSAALVEKLVALVGG